MGKLAVISVTLENARTSSLLQGVLWPSTIRAFFSVNKPNRLHSYYLLCFLLSRRFTNSSRHILSLQVNRIFPIAITSLSYECNLVSLLPIRRRRRPHSAAFPVTHIPSAFSAVAGALTSEYQANVTLFRPSVISQKCKLSSVCIRVSRSET